MATIGQSGSVSPGRWWSVTIMSTPSRRASSTSATAVMPQSTVRMSFDALLGEARDRRRGDAVALLEPARQVPADVGAELPQRQHRERRRADAVDVVVAVDADPLAALDRRLACARRPPPCRRGASGSWAMPSGSRNALAASGSSSPRRTSTVASVSETPSAAISSLTSGNETGSTFQLPTMSPR